MSQEFSLEAFQARLATRYVGRRLLYYPSLASTQDVARQEAESGAPEGATILADRQTAGRGRLGRSWVSPAGGNLYFSVVLRPAAEHLRTLGMICPLAICQAVEEVTGLQPRLKWPNDVLVGPRKLAGVLIDSGLSGDKVDYAICGIGINVNFDVMAYEEIREIATSVSAELGREVAREELLAAVLGRFEALYEAARRGEPVHLAWKERLNTLGRRVRVGFADRVEEGIAEDAEPDGTLVLRRPDGSLVRIEAGDTVEPSNYGTLEPLER
jgi:BirA family biotin operon repressor/biotin-[acetyl-CoA-carboxylase] ligase